MDCISERLKQLRISKGVTQKQVAEFLNVAPNSIQRFEYGTNRPSIDSIIKLCTYFNVSADYLLGLSDNPTRQ